MCLVIDTSTLASVFDETAVEHKRFVPVLDWLMSRDGKMIYGGKKYAQELSGNQARRIVLELDRSGKLVRMPDAAVNKIATSLKKKEPKKAFNDEHLLGLVIASKCRVICTDDKAAIPFIKRRDLYPKGFTRPRIYQRARDHAELCASQNVVSVCR